MTTHRILLDDATYQALEDAAIAARRRDGGACHAANIANDILWGRRPPLAPTPTDTDPKETNR